MVVDALQVEKSKRRPRRYPSVKRLFLWLTIFSTICYACLFLMMPSFKQIVSGQFVLAMTRYPYSQFQYSGNRIVGSSEWQDRVFILWTEDSIDSVRQHYNEHFDEVESSREYDAVHYSFHRTFYDIVDDWGFSLDRFSINIRLVEASEENRAQLLIAGYDGDPYSILENLPTYGTIIIFHHDIFAP